MRQGPLTFIAHRPLRSPRSLCNPTDLSGLMSASDVAASRTASSSNADSTSRLENLLLPASYSRRVALFAQDLIICHLLYYGDRSTTIRKSSAEALHSRVSEAQ